MLPPEQKFPATHEFPAPVQSVGTFPSTNELLAPQLPGVIVQALQALQPRVESSMLAYRVVETVPQLPDPASQLLPAGTQMLPAPQPPPALPGTQKSS